jgi:hypothetical protein
MIRLAVRNYAVSVSTFLVAGCLDLPELRSLDALHLAAALELGDDLEGVVTYDGRMIAGAKAVPITVVSPGAPSRNDWGA